MGSYNRVTIAGNLGRDAELRFTQSGTPVSTFSVATTDTWNDKDTGEKKERTEWHRCVLWGKAAESLSEYLVKGKQILVEGSLQTRKWQDKDGHDKYTTEIRAGRVVLLGSRGDGAGKSRRQSEDREAGEAVGGDPVDAGQTAGGEITDDDIPFVWLVPFLLPLAVGVKVVLSSGIV